MRAASEDQEAALAQGISVGAVFALSWALAGALAAIAGTFTAVGASVNEQLWLTALTALPVIILGGLDSLPGAVVGGLAIGVVQELVATYQLHTPWLGGNFSVVSPYVVMLLVLLVRPFGLFGTREVERV
jgi:branched-chain amino acid transport system permease protein